MIINKRKEDGKKEIVQRKISDDIKTGWRSREVMDDKGDE